jgi:multidrug efflux pump
MTIIDAAFGRSRVIMLVFFMILVSGAFAYKAIPKESEPDIPIPTFYVSMSHEGISPEDAERLLVRPMEKELQSLEGLKEMRSVAGESYASVTLEFNAGFDSDEALLDIREKVDLAKSELPPDTNEPRVMEVNVALFPVLSVALSGALPERELVSIARDLQDKLEALPGVLEAQIGGDREEMMEVVVDPSVMESYDVTFQDITALLQNNNRLIAAGAIDTGAGRMVLKVPGVIEGIDDVMSLPLKTAGDTVVTFKDVVSIRRTFKDPESFARIAGEGALVLEISKRLGANIIETIEDVQAVIAQEQKHWPATLEVTFMQDKSVQIRDMLRDLQNNVLSAVVLVMIVIVAALGVRPALLVGMAIPGSFLAGILVIYGMGLTINIVVLFSLILVVGMLVDGAIVTIELADRKIAEGLDRKKAYAVAAKRMSWPIIASTATTLAVFVPLLFWPGMVGEFMKYLPITVLCTLVASLFMALVFIPVLGGLVGSKEVGDKASLNAIRAAEDGNLEDVQGATGRYLRFLEKMLHHPLKVLMVALAFLILTFVAFKMFGKGVEFFPDIEPEFIQVQVQARGDLSIYEKDDLVKRVEQKMLGMDVFQAIYSRTYGNVNNQHGMPADVIGVIQLEFVNWRLRAPASDIIEDVRGRLSDVAGIKVQVRKAESGPSAGKPIEVEIRSDDMAKLALATQQVQTLMDEVGGFVDIEDSRPLPGIEWRLEIDREQAARYGADVSTLGSAVQMLTTGLKLAEYQPDDADEELDIRLRFPRDERSLEQLLQLRVPTSTGHIPVNNFIAFETAQKTGNITRVDSRRVMSVKSDVSEGLLVDSQVRLLKQAVASSNFDPAVSVHFKGQDAEQAEAGAFLAKAFLIAVFMMTTILVTQFNSFYQAGLVLSAIIFSTAGVLIGLLITGNPFGVVMGGIGVIALAGIVVNNNIILIDTFNDMKRKNIEPMEAILRTAAQRMRPVLLTSITTILGLIPMVFAMNIDFFNQDIAFGAPSSQWWIQLSSAIAGGLAFATLLTLILTPCLLMIGESMSLKFNVKKLFSPASKTSTH